MKHRTTFADWADLIDAMPPPLGRYDSPPPLAATTSELDAVWAQSQAPISTVYAELGVTMPPHFVPPRPTGPGVQLLGVPIVEIESWDDWL